MDFQSSIGRNCTPPIRSSGPTTISSGGQRRGHLPNEEAIARLVGAILLEQNDEWAVQRARYVMLETIALLSDTQTLAFAAQAS
jgi:hypothetical protein